MEHMKQIEVLVPLSEMTFTAVQDGMWSDVSTWGGTRLPNTDAKVHIPSGIVVTYDRYNDTPLSTVRVDGSLLLH